MATQKNARNLQAFVGLVAIALVAVSLAMTADRADALFRMVETGVSELSPDGRHVAVNIPGIFNMVLDTRGKDDQNRSMGARMSQSVMLGLVRLELDRERNGDNMRGPISVSIGGFPIYENSQSS